jgi:hypothetical protein
MIKHMTIENNIMNGARMTVLMIIMKENWTLVISVVVLVTMEAGENLSMFLKEYC